jgi:hypothetical protein
MMRALLFLPPSPSSGISTNVRPVWFVRVLVERIGLVLERLRVSDRWGVPVPVVVVVVVRGAMPERRKKPLRSSDGWKRRTRARGRVKAT